MVSECPLTTRVSALWEEKMGTIDRVLSVAFGAALAIFATSVSHDIC